MKKLLTLFFVVPVLFLTGCAEKVETGQTGIKTIYGVMDSKPLPPGLYWINPFSTDIIMIENREQVRLDSITQVTTKDVQKVALSYTINYYVIPEMSVKLASAVGMNYDERLMPQAIKGAITQTIGQWDAITFVSNRQKVSLQIKDAIGKTLEPYGIKVTGFQITSDEFSPVYMQSVEAKVTALQRAEEAKNNTIKVQEEANQRIIAAKADAEAMTIKSKALEQNRGLIMYNAVDKWNGQLPKIISGDAGAILNIPDSVLSDMQNQQ